MKKLLFLLAMIWGMFIVGTQAQVTAFYESFENGIPAGWTNLDVDNDGHTWVSSPNDNMVGTGYTGDGLVVSYSTNNNTPLTPDNWLITPPITLGTNATLSYARCVLFFYYAEHYGVYVSTTTTDPSAFTLVYEETCMQSQYGWHERTVDLSDYDGETVYIAFRHTGGTSSQNLRHLALDDIAVTMTTASAAIMVSPFELDFGTIPMGTPSFVQEVDVTGYNITNGLTASVNSPFEVSTDSITFLSSVTLPDTGGTVYVRYYPVAAAVDNDVLTVTDGTISQTVNLVGEALDCSAYTLPYTQNFDDVPSYSIPDCWYQIDPYMDYPQVTGNHSHSGKSMMFRCNASTGNPVYAVMPQMPQDLYTLQISFWTSAEGTNSGTFSVGYVTDPSDNSTFVPVWSKNYADMGDNNYHPFIVNFSDVAIDATLNYYIAFKYEVSTNWYWYLDDITVEEIPSCNGPTGLAVSQVTSNSATLSWEGSTDNYVVYYKRAVDNEWTSIPDVVFDSAGYVLDSLLPTTNYVWYVASECEDGSLVNSMGTGAFKTECAVYVAPFVEDFDAQNSIPDCWERLTGLASNAFSGIAPTSTTSGWDISSNVFGSRHPKVNIWGSNVKNWLVTPPIDLSLLSNPVLIFDLALTDYNNANPIESMTNQGDDKFMVIVSTDNGATWNAANATVWSDDPTLGDYPFSQIPTTGQEVVLSLAAYANQTVMIAFYGESTMSGGDNDLHIDNVVVGEAPTCPKPAIVTVDSVSHNYAEVSWPGSSAVNAWLLEYRASYDTSWTVQTVTDTMFALSGLNMMTHYLVRVSSICDDGEISAPTSTSFTTTMAPQNLPYSTDFGPSADRSWALNNGTCGNYWTIGELDGNSALFITNNGNTAGYTQNGSFSLVTAEKTFTVGDASEFSISFDVKVGGESNFDYLKVFFATEEEEFPASNTNQAYSEYQYNVHAVNFPSALSDFPYILSLTGGNIVHVEVSMPNPNPNASISTNSTAKLVFLWKNDTSDGSQPGAVIYNVSVAPVTCSMPTGLTVSNVTTSTADLTWVPSGIETLWNIEYKAATDSSWTAVSTSITPTYTLNGLTEGTLYQVRVQADCENSQSMWLESTFSTFCDVVSEFPYTEGFEHDGDMADCWSQEAVIGSVNWTFKSGNYNSGTTAHSGNYNAYFQHSSNSNFTTKLVSPIFDLSNMADPYLTYWFTQEPWVSDQDILMVYYRTSPNSDWIQLTVHNSGVVSWTKDSLALPNPTATYQIAFEGRANYGYGITLDDITVNGTEVVPIIPDTCDTPTGLVSNEITHESIAVSWDADANVSMWNVRFREIGATAWNTHATTINSYTISGLASETEYQIQVQADCGEGNVSEWSAAITATTEPNAVGTYLETSVTLYPNPAKEVVHVRIDGDLNVTTMEVFDVYGKLVRTVETLRATSPQTAQINVSGLADGMYFVRVTTEQGVVTKRFVKK